MDMPLLRPYGQGDDLYRLRAEVFGAWRRRTIGLTILQDVLYSVNTQHDCEAAGCGPTGEREIKQERKISGRVVKCIVHLPLEQYILNTFSFHNVDRLAATLPGVLQVLTPVVEIAQRREVRAKHARALAEKRAAVKAKREEAAKAKADAKEAERKAAAEASGAAASGAAAPAASSAAAPASSSAAAPAASGAAAPAASGTAAAGGGTEVEDEDEGIFLGVGKHIESGDEHAVDGELDDGDELEAEGGHRVPTLTRRRGRGSSEGPGGGGEGSRASRARGGRGGAPESGATRAEDSHQSIKRRKRKRH
jgi:hypothetical protein